MESRNGSNAGVGNHGGGSGYGTSPGHKTSPGHGMSPGHGTSPGIGKHRFSMEQRRECKLTGVVDVQSFDENNILMETVDGMLTIKGENLHVGRLNLEKGEADVDGTVNSFVYADKNTLAKKGEGLLTRLFG